MVVIKFIVTFVTLNNTTMNIRLKQFLAAENISQSQFADTIMVVRASVSHVLSGRNKPSYEFIRAIMLSYPHLNMDWLLVGKGKMYKETVQNQGLPVAETIPTMEDLLFSDDDDQDQTHLSTAQEYPIDLSIPTPTPSTQTSANIITSNDNTQTTVKQRKVSKIIVMFDDGTFQEM